MEDVARPPSDPPYRFMQHFVQEKKRSSSGLTVRLLCSMSFDCGSRDECSLTGNSPAPTTRHTACCLGRYLIDDG